MTVFSLIKYQASLSSFDTFKKAKSNGLILKVRKPVIWIRKKAREASPYSEEARIICPSSAFPFFA